MIFLRIISEEVLQSGELYFFLGFVLVVMILMYFRPKVLLAFFRIPRNIFINLKKEQLPDWSKAPKWAKFVAQDSNGTWRWHYHKPKLVDGYWISVLPTTFNHAGFSKISEKSFEKSLQAKPK